jgi:ABC-type transporter Mla subunit MlaD
MTDTTDNIAARLNKISMYTEQIPAIQQKLDATITAAKSLNGTIRDLASALNLRDDIHTKNIFKLSAENEALRELVGQLASDLDNIKEEVIQRITALKSQVAALHDLLPEAFDDD